MRPMILVTLIGLACLATPGHAAEFHDATEPMTKLGAAGYWSSPIGAKSRVEYLGGDGNVLTTVHLDVSDPSSIEMRMTIGDEPAGELVLVWDQVHGTLRVWPPGAIEPLETNYEFRTGSWKGDARLQDIAKLYSREIGLAALALDATHGHSKTSRPPVTPSCAALSPLAGDLVFGGGGDIYCDGFRCRGFGAAGAASLCCEDAWQDASNCCTNGICWGCCAFLGCDTACGLGSYICFCGVTGIECSYPDF